MFGVRYIKFNKQVENNPYSTRIQPVFNKYYLDLKMTYFGGSHDVCWTILRLAEGFGSEDIEFNFF